MEAVRFRKWELLVDPEATRQAYAATEIGWAEFCGCVHCRNFQRARERAYPPEARDLLHRLGIDPARELDLQPVRPERQERYTYSGFFQFVGSLVSGPEFWREHPEGGLTNDPDGMETLADDFILGFSSRLGRVLKPFQGKPLVELEFIVTAPWLLERRMPDL